MSFPSRFFAHRMQLIKWQKPQMLILSVFEAYLSELVKICIFIFFSVAI